MHRSNPKAPKFMFVSALLLLLVAVTLGVSGKALAQSATTGAIVGTVADTAGALLPGTVVTVVSKDTKAERKTKTNSSGEYRIPELDPGAYTVTFVADGFQTVQEDTVTVTVGGSTTLTPKLTVGSVSDKVEVSGDQQPLLNTTGPEISTTLSQDMIDNLPINGRRWSSFALLTPGVVSNGDGFGLLSFRGISFLLNNSQVDGADNNQAYFSEERGRTRASYSISQAAVQEFQVNSSNYSAEYGRAAGGVINTVTKSGSNQFHGELFFYDRDNQWGAENPYTQIVTQVPNSNSFVSTPYKAQDWRKQWGFGIGGPIIKDKLFWFYSYDQSRRNFPGTGRASDPADTFAPAATTLPTGATCSASTSGSTPGTLSGDTATGDIAACSLAGALNLGGGSAGYQRGAAYYTQGLGIISSYLGTVPRTSDQVLNFPKIDWQVNDRNRLTVQYNRLRYSSPAGVQTQASNFYGRSSFGNDYVKDDFGILRYTSVLSNSLVNEFRAQYGRDYEYENDEKPLPNELPLVSQFGVAPDIQLGYEFDLTGYDIGGTYLGLRNAYPDERRIQAADGLTYSKGAHTIKFGFDINRVYDHTDNLYQGTGSYSYDYSWDFISDYLNRTTGLGGPGYTQQFYSYSQGVGNGVISISTTDWNGYLTDTWRATPTLTLTAGVRYEYEYIPPNPFPNTGNPALTAIVSGANGFYPSAANSPLPQTANRPDDRNNFGPRVGFAWNVFGDGKTTLRGGYGMFYGRVINANISLAYSNSGSTLGQTSLSTYSYNTAATHGGCTNLFPTVFPSSETALATLLSNKATTTTYGCANETGAPTIPGIAPFTSPTVAFMDKHMQNPQVHEADLSLQQDLGWGTVLDLTYMGSFGRELPSVYDTNAPLTTRTTTDIVDNTDSITALGAGLGAVLPHGGKPPALPNGATEVFKYYCGPTSPGTICPAGTQGRPNPNYYAIYEVSGEVTSSYNALAIQLNKRFSHGLSFLSNYTWAKAMDYNPYLSTSYGSSSYLPVDPQDRKQDYGRSNLNVGNRYVFAAHYNPTFGFNGWKKYVLDGWGISPIVQAQTGLPYSATTSGSQNGGAVSGILGAGGAARLPKYDVNGNLVKERNIYNMPKTADFDLRLSKSFAIDRFGQHMRLEMFAELFNVMNHQNITSVNTGAYTICSSASTLLGSGGCPAVKYPSTGSLLIHNPGFGTYNNSNSTTLTTPRQLQIAARLHF